MAEIDDKLLRAISDQDISRVKELLAQGANPNATTGTGETALMEACSSWHTPENRFRMAEALIDAGADLAYVNSEAGEALGALFECVLAKDARLIEFLISRGADPNKEYGLGETLYDLAEFDYRFDEYEHRLPEKPAESDKATEESWLAFLTRLAARHRKNPPDYLLALRKGGALTGKEKRGRS
jgi:hypothetical protein